MIDTATLSVKLCMISWICKLYMISWICKLYMISWICKLYMISWICKLYMISWICKLYDCSLLMIYRRTDASMTSLIINNILLFYHMKPIKSMLPCGSSVIYHRWRQNVVKTSPLFCSYHVRALSVIYYCKDAMQHEIYNKSSDFDVNYAAVSPMSEVKTNQNSGMTNKLIPGRRASVQ